MSKQKQNEHQKVSQQQLEIRDQPWDHKQSKQFRKEYPNIMPDSCLGNKSDIFYYNNENNQLKRQVQPPKDVF